MSLGGKGVISVTANIIPEDTHDMVHKYLEGDVAGSLALQLKAIDLCDAMFCEVNPIPVKKAVELAGLCASVEKIKKAMVEYGIKLA